MELTEADGGSSAAGATDRDARRPQWAAFWSMLGIAALIIAIPVTLGAAAPVRDANAAGFHESVNFVPSSEGETQGFGGFVAPEGWIWVTPEDPSEAERFKQLRSPDGASGFIAEFVTDVSDPEAELRGSAPAGSALQPIVSGATGSGFTTYRMQDDHAAGDAITERVLVCGLPPQGHVNCVKFVITDAENSDWDDAIHGLIDSVEVF